LVSCRAWGGGVDSGSKGDGGEIVVFIIAKGSANGFERGGFKKCRWDVGRIVLGVKGTKGCKDLSSGLGGETI
jgi:hypothetical protein